MQKLTTLKTKNETYVITIPMGSHDFFNFLKDRFKFFNDAILMQMNPLAKHIISYKNERKNTITIYYFDKQKKIKIYYNGSLKFEYSLRIKKDEFLNFMEFVEKNHDGI